jgi:hypothetical protein
VTVTCSPTARSVELIVRTPSGGIDVVGEIVVGVIVAEVDEGRSSEVVALCEVTLGDVDTDKTAAPKVRAMSTDRAIQECHRPVDTVPGYAF